MKAAGKSLSELAALVGGKVLGDENVKIQRVASIDEAVAGDITFFTSPRYQAYLESCKASAIIIGNDVTLPAHNPFSLLVVNQPYLAFAKVLDALTPKPQYDGRISPLSTVSESAVIGKEVTVFPNVYIGEGAKVGRGTVLFPSVFLGEGVEVGEDCVLHPQVTVREGCRLGNRVLLHAGVVIGSDGFGFAEEQGVRKKIPQVGNVEVGDDVEIGANTTVDRATLGCTRIGRGTKIDNLVQIAHNVVVGDNSVIIAQAGIAGSTRIGKEVIVAGQAGIVNHIEIGDRVRIGPRSGIGQSLPAGAVVSGGLPAAPHKDWIKVMVLLPRLPKLWNTVRQLERKLAQLSRRAGKRVTAHDGR
ncbi:MAG: UDP-3-O-(3-hydroxymyristoyl)glucosamine N-acyltransferase [Deltaproteobacteria bacterium]|nr:UDP-3-O-(3-hydroxymyristoyl)glucosamine N-acyltransferase [Deltaproteobacteria bacterium]